MKRTSTVIGTATGTPSNVAGENLYFLTAFNAQTVPVFLSHFQSTEGEYWALLAAAATVACLPVILAGWIAQKQLVRGLSLGALK